MSLLKITTALSLSRSFSLSSSPSHSFPLQRSFLSFPIFKQEQEERILFYSLQENFTFLDFSSLSWSFRRIVSMSAIGTRNPVISLESMAISPPSHPTYDLKAVISLALSEDAGDRGSLLFPSSDKILGFLDSI